VPIVGEAGKVLFSDVSEELLDDCRRRVDELGVTGRCGFLRASADDLSSLPAQAVNLVTLKAVLIFVADKRRAFQEFYRVLGTGGRLYVEEPINRFAFPEPDHLFWGYDVAPIQDLAHKVRAVYRRIQPPDSDPMLDFDERDLMALAEEAGFTSVRIEYQAGTERRKGPVEWGRFWDSAPNLRVPTLEEAVAQALTPDEAEEFVAYLKPRVGAETITLRWARSYLWAVKS
jgi:arsenite methyltransferase